MPVFSLCICATLDDQVSSPLISFYPSRKLGFFNNLTGRYEEVSFLPRFLANKSSQVSNRTLSRQTALIAAKTKNLSDYSVQNCCTVLSGNPIRATSPVFPFA
jgi:hypothetical protein